MSEMCEQLHHILSEASRFRFPFDEYRVPQSGISVMFERGEKAHDADRIVHIGTHTGNKRLGLRLNEHITPNKDRSILRKYIGEAMLNRDQDPFLEQWKLDLTTVAAREAYESLVDFDKQAAVESQVTDYIQENYSFAIFRVVSRDKRFDLKWKIISTVSLCDECKPSDSWLGLHSPFPKIQQSGLWLVKGLYKEPLSENDFEALREMLL
jgi:hypothetical protein